MIRLVIATVAFGMGLDIPDITQVVHVGLPAEIELNVQESGSSGRNGQLTQTILLRNTSTHSLRAMREYASNTSECRRMVLFRTFIEFVRNQVHGCKCCDMCAASCTCGNCSQCMNSDKLLY